MVTGFSVGSEHYMEIWWWLLERQRREDVASTQSSRIVTCES